MLSFWSKLVSLIPVCFSLATTSICANEGATGEGKIRIGTFDTRAVAIAYYRTPEYLDSLKQLHTQHKQAKEANDEKQAEQLENKGRRLQDLMHYQGFGNAPVNNILDKIDKELATIAKDSQVSIIVSQWDIAFKNSDIETVDVTDKIVELFEPSKETRKAIEQLRKTKPVPLNKLETHK